MMYLQYFMLGMEVIAFIFCMTITFETVLEIIRKKWGTRMKEAYEKVYIVRNSDNIPLKQEYMTLNQAIQRYNQEINEAKKLGLYVSDKDFNIYDTKREKVVL